MKSNNSPWLSTFFHIVLWSLVALMLLILFQVNGDVTSLAVAVGASSNHGQRVVGEAMARASHGSGEASDYLLGWYSGINAAQRLAELASFGTNLVIPYDIPSRFEEHERARVAFLDEAHKQGVKVLLDLNREWVLDIEEQANQEALRSFINAYKDHPAVYGWYLFDEPDVPLDNPRVSPAKLKQAYEVVKTADPQHPVAVVFSASALWNFSIDPAYFDGFDLLMIDFYPIHHGQPEFGRYAGQREWMPVWIKRVDTYAALVNQRGKQGLIMVLQGYGVDDNGNPLWDRRDPTQAELRFMLYSTAIRDSAGVLFFAEYRANRRFGLQQRINALIKEARALGTPLRNGAFNSPAIARNNCAINYRYGVDGNIHYLIAVNETGSNQDGVRFRLPRGIEAMQVEVVGENRTLPVFNAQFQDDFARYQVHVYRFSPIGRSGVQRIRSLLHTFGASRISNKGWTIDRNLDRHWHCPNREQQDSVALDGWVPVPLNVSTLTPTVTLTPTFTPTNTPTNTPTSTPTNTPTSTPTSTPTNIPTSTPTHPPTATPSPTTTATPMQFPIITELRPNQGTNDVPNEITIHGKHFARGAVAILYATSSITLTNTIWLDHHTLRSTVPSGLPSGAYDLRVVNPDGRHSNALLYTVIDATGGDDLYANSYELYTDPVTIYEGDQVGLYLIVHRQGGKQTLSNVIARFYDGHPDHDGVPIGDGRIFLLGPQSSEITTRVEWDTIDKRGGHMIYAVIDPDNEISETVEGNNVVRRAITVLEPPGDTIPPQVTAFQINDGAEITLSPQVSLSVSAEDNANGSGVEGMLFVELVFNQAVLQWVPVQTSDWLPYLTHYAWSLVPTAGTHYLQAWAADKGGNISLSPMKARINYVPVSDQVEANQVRLYRQHLTAGQRLTVVLTPLSGDPDLYVWPPVEGGAPRVSNNGGAAEDRVSFVAEVSGTYQIEVYGYTAARYTIDIEVTGSVTQQDNAKATPSTIVSPNTEKPPRTAPVTSVSDEPVGQVAVPPAELCYDIDGNEQIDVLDVARVAVRWGQGAGKPYDVDRDGVVTVLDIMRVISQWGQSCVCYDINGDNQVEATDLAAVAARWRLDAGELYDLDRNGVVTVLDIMQLILQWGQTCQRR